MLTAFVTPYAIAIGVPPCDVAIIGAGVAGLRAARVCSEAGLTVRLFEASDGVGGRVRSDRHSEGFILDRGFQVFIEDYPEARRVLDYDALRLARFDPGALVLDGSSVAAVSDPLRRPQDTLAALLSPVGTPLDKLRLGLLIARLRLQPLERALQPTPPGQPEASTEAYLRELGLSAGIIDGFFRPFLQGVFLAPLAQQSSRMFEFVFSLFSTGAACLPADGMGAVAAQLAADLPRGCVELNAEVAALEPGGLSLADGTEVRCAAVVLATDAPAASRLLATRGEAAAAPPPELRRGLSSTCLYFAVEGPPPVTRPVLCLNARAGGAAFPDDRAPSSPAASDAEELAGAARQVVVNNLCFPSVVCPSYAPPGRTLASVNVLGSPDLPEARPPPASPPPIVSPCESRRDETLPLRRQAELVAAVLAQCEGWFGEGVRGWRFLRRYTVPYAQPAQAPLLGDDFERRPRGLGGGVYLCGDHTSTPTLNGALASGEAAARELMADMEGVSS